MRVSPAGKSRPSAGSERGYRKVFREPLFGCGVPALRLDGGLSAHLERSFSQVECVMRGAEFRAALGRGGLNEANQRRRFRRCSGLVVWV